jgi:nucleotide-binding universal stress UspA family protein
LLAVDGSEGAARATSRVLALRDALRDGAALELHLLTVDRPLSGDVTRFIAGKTVNDYHREQGDAALAPARALLDAGGLAHQDHQRIGEPGPTIADAARELGCDMIVVGARGLSAPAAALLGSVAHSAIEHATVPVLVVK